MGRSPTPYYEITMMFNNFNVQGLLRELELQIEIEELRKIGLSEEEIEGYFELYMDSWMPDLQNQTSADPN